MARLGDPAMTGANPPEAAAHSQRKLRRGTARARVVTSILAISSPPLAMCGPPGARAPAVRLDGRPTGRTVGDVEAGKDNRGSRFFVPGSAVGAPLRVSSPACAHRKW